MSGSRPTEPLPWIRRFARLVPAASDVLDLAAGGGRNATLFLERGHGVTAVDVDTSGLSGLAGHPGLEVTQADLEDGSPWPLGDRRFGGVVVTNYLWRPLFPAIVAAVAEGGVLLYETFALGDEAPGRPRRSEFLLRPGELIDAVRGELTIVAYEHGRVAEPRPAVKQRICAVRADRPASLD